MTELERFIETGNTLRLGPGLVEPNKPNLFTIQQVVSLLYKARDNNLAIRPDSHELVWVGNLQAAFDLLVEEVAKRSIPVKRLRVEYPELPTYAIASAARDKADAADTIPTVATPTVAKTKRASPQRPVHKGLKSKIMEVLSDGGGGPVTYHSVRMDERLSLWDHEHRTVSNAVSSLVLHGLVKSNKERRYGWSDKVILEITAAGKKYCGYAGACEKAKAHKMDILDWAREYKKGNIVMLDTAKKGKR